MKSATFQTRIPTWMEMEIDAIRSQYFDSRMPKLYWPKLIRAFLKELIDAAIVSLGEEAFISVDDLEKVTKQLNEPTSVYIPVKHRNTIKEAIDIIRLRSPNYGFVLEPPSEILSLQITACEWPNDVLEKEDLYSSLCKMTLRIDVESFIWNLLQKLFSDPSIYKFYCTANILDEKSKPHYYPIIVEIQGDDKCRQLTSYLHTISKIYRLTYQGTLPADVIQVKVREEISEIFVKDEKFHSNDSLLKYVRKLIKVPEQAHV